MKTNIIKKMSISLMILVLFFFSNIFYIHADYKDILLYPFDFINKNLKDAKKLFWTNLFKPINDLSRERQEYIAKYISYNTESIKLYKSIFSNINISNKTEKEILKIIDKEKLKKDKLFSNKSILFCKTQYKREISINKLIDSIKLTNDENPIDIKDVRNNEEFSNLFNDLTSNRVTIFSNYIETNWDCSKYLWDKIIDDNNDFLGISSVSNTNIKINNFIKNKKLVLKTSFETIQKLKNKKLTDEEKLYLFKYYKNLIKSFKSENNSTPDSLLPKK